MDPLRRLEAALAGASPRLSAARTPFVSLLIHAAVVLLLVAASWQAFTANDATAWSVGLVYIAYDTMLIAIVFCQTLPLRRTKPRRPPQGARPTLSVIVAAHDEADVLAFTLRALLRQHDPADLVLIADDGSRDATPAALRPFGLVTPRLGAMARSLVHPNLAWLRVPHGGKARALNAALLQIETDIVVTVDGDTLLDAGAIGALRDAFAEEPSLVAATGVLTPICGSSLAGRFYGTFQTYEYVRNFLSRYAWTRFNALLLISGAFAGFRRDALLAVGGFDPATMVEDYELIHRLLRYGARNGLGWRTGIVGGARAVTDAPAQAGAFLRQRRRWFCGFLQTQYWYRDMVGDRRYGRLGTIMLPIKAFDTLQPIFGLCAGALGMAFVVSGRRGALPILAGAIGAKIAIDFAFHLWAARLYRRWADPKLPARVFVTLLVAVVEPFTFQLLRQLGPALGWAAFLTGDRAWGHQTRTGLVATQTYAPLDDMTPFGARTSEIGGTDTR